MPDLSRQKSSRIGDILLEKGIISEEQLEKSLEIQRKTGDYLGEILIYLGFADTEQVYCVLSRQRGIPYIDITDLDIESEILEMIPRDFAEKFTVLPLFVEGDSIKIAVADHLDVNAFDGISSMTGLHPEPMLNSRRNINKAIRENYARPDQLERDMRQLVEEEKDNEKPLNGEFKIHDSEPDTPAVRFVNLIIQQGIDRKASDLHLEPHKDSIVLRYRIDGILHKATPPSRQLYSAVVARIKVLANLDVAEYRLPQDGRLRLDKYDVDIRMSIIPTIHGEKVLMRFLDQTQLVLDLEKLGLSIDQQKILNTNLQEPQGIILVTGPTGSGKTTTLYSSLAYINTPDVNIMTVEDPVEYTFANINQIQVKSDIGLTFASVLRSMLRQDPDVLMVGEIRDMETGQIAMRASMTGHLVLSTIHTLNAVATISRLQAMGLQAYLLASSLNLIVAQRLVRQICHRCKKVYKPLPENLEALGLPAEGEYYAGKGCKYCNNTGYRDRIGIYEMLPVTKELSWLIARNAEEEDLEKSETYKNMVTLRQSGAEKVKEGITTVEEVLAKAPEKDSK